MKGWLMGAIIALGGGLTPAADAPSELALAKARIVQLEFQMQQLDAMRTGALANLATCMEPQKREKIEKEAGCPGAMNWDVVPPACKSVTK